VNVMNKARRKRLDVLSETLAQVRSELEDLASEERDAFDNMPEGLQQGERGQATEAAAGAIENGMNAVDEVVSAIEEAVQ
jgi:ectoine hydroxylase-related dioxygenase (phytanoyl-CoA dioxygenase family)